MFSSKVVSVYKEPVYIVFRIVVGLLFLEHGLQKFGLFGEFNFAGFATAVGIPLWLAYVVAVVELLGGLFIALGLFTRFAVIATSIDMVGALLLIHFPQGPIPLQNQGELALLYLFSFILIFMKGARGLSLDSLFFKRG